MGHVTKALDMVRFANDLLGGTGPASERAEDLHSVERRPEIQEARMEEYFGYCRSCGKGQLGYTIRCDEVQEDELPDLCPFCGSRAEVKPLWE